jgi:hypothetical protein
MSEDPYSGVSCGVALRNLRVIFRRCVIHDDHFKIAKGLIETALDCLGEELAAPIARDHD